jgi:hypothetical protein
MEADENAANIYASSNELNTSVKSEVLSTPKI